MSERTKMRLFIAEMPSPRLWLAPSIKKSTTAAAETQTGAPQPLRLYLTVRK